MQAKIIADQLIFAYILCQHFFEFAQGNIL